ncbi:hypothetical protein IC235_06020 [Hymenobacter sp. BT664]|uniref:DUF7878 domain-containing protein n=1 Tax=Hymenobacter montanus TaxID=2771359 RepID=A0A927BBY0_9BACT|nr:hypothetical protein [Hymenobacter montanus]MBD2767445.1 hypothetical protein [Hymenobacter montanus]
MKIAFSIEKINSGFFPMHPYALLEGKLSVCIRDAQFFCEDGIWLVELGMAIQKWLTLVKTKGHVDFVYLSIEHDSPIFTISMDQDDICRIYSEWSEIPDGLPIQLTEVIKCFEKYLTVLDEFLRVVLELRFANLYKKYA